MKILMAALLFVAVSAAAEPIDSQPGTTPDTSQAATTTNSARTQTSQAGSATDDASSDDPWSSTASGLNYETGEVCVTRGAGGICLESGDD